MTALAKALSSLSGLDLDVDTLKLLIILSGVGLLISIVCALTYGLDLSPGFF
jgi:hypothetical protein